VFFYGGYFYIPRYTSSHPRPRMATRTCAAERQRHLPPIATAARGIGGSRINVSTALQDRADAYQEAGDRAVFRGASCLNVLLQETTVFRDFGPLAGNTMRLHYDVAPKIGNTLSRQTFDADVRYYQRIASSGVFAVRARGFKSIGDFPDYIYFGGNSEMRGYDYLEFIGQNVVFANAELRFPIIEAALTPFGVIGGVRGVFFANIGGGWFQEELS
jgi:hypothetical protein